MSESEKESIVTKPALGQGHPAQCWGWWDAKAKECGDCIVAEKCADATRRLSGKSMTPVSAPAPTPVPAPAKPAVASVAAPATKPIAKPKSITAPSPEETPAPKAEVKSNVQEPKPEPKADKPADRIADAITPRTKGEVVKEENGDMVLYTFKNSAGQVVLKAGLKKSIGKIKMGWTKGSKILDLNFTDADMKAALDELL